jgi:hypothetical protein
MKHYLVGTLMDASWTSTVKARYQRWFSSIPRWLALVGWYRRENLGVNLYRE